MMEHQTEKKHYQGLRDAEVIENRARFGSNVLPPPHRDPWYRALWHKFDDSVIRILLIAAVLACVSGEWIEGAGILLAILLATFLAFINEYRAGKAFDILNKTDDAAPVDLFRNGKLTQVAKAEVVVGDILYVAQGAEVPADGEVLESFDLSVDQSKLTGESHPVRKVAEVGEGTQHEEETYPVNMLLRGTNVMEGHGIMRVTQVGANTQVGKTVIAASTITNEVTPLNAQLQKLSQFIGMVGLTISVVTFSALVLHGVLSGSLQQSAAAWGILVIGIAAVVCALSRVFVPILYDGMRVFRPNMQTPRFFAQKTLRAWLMTGLAALAIFGLGIGIMALCGALPEQLNDWMAPDVRKAFLGYFMIAVALIVVAVPEGLAMSVTLSLAYSMRKMTASNNLVRRMHACESIGAASVICTDKTGTLTMNQMTVQSVHFSIQDTALIHHLMAVNAGAQLGTDSQNKTIVLGNPTEGALLLYLRAEKVDYTALRDAFTIEKQWPFTTENKYMATQGRTADGTPYLLVKGAPEIVLQHCHMAADEKERYLAEFITYQDKGMRTLGFAFSSTFSSTEKALDNRTDLTFAGFVAIADAVRPDVPDAMRACRSAGIEVKMLTGDSVRTAREIARQSHLIEPDEALHQQYGVMTGPEFAALPDDQALTAASELRIMARARPEDKLRLVRLLKRAGQVVAVTGDGTNDAPALNYADVGIAMGKTGTSAAKEAADIILLDDAFPSIVNAVLWGRSLYCNIQKFVAFQLTVNFVALFIAMIGPIIGVDMPLTVIQMLWVNLIMDTFAALALATEPPDPTLLNKPPRKSDAFIITRGMRLNIFITGAFFIAALLGLLLYGKAHDVSENLHFQTVFFTALIMMQFWNLFNAKCLGRSDSLFAHVLHNKIFLLITALIFVTQIIVVTFGGKAFRVEPLSLRDFCLIILATSFILVGGEVVRFMQRRKHR